MNKLIFTILFFAAALLGVTAEEKNKKQTTTKAGKVEISFDYERKSGPGSNQYAVWIENESGAVVKTLFVTSFTTKGRVREGQPLRRGYTYRPACVPTWVSHARAAEMTDVALDAITGATPKESGVQTFCWDFTDAEGKTVSEGNYKICLEATFKNEYKILYVGTISTASLSASTVEMKETVSGWDEAYSGMIKNVKVICKP